MSKATLVIMAAGIGSRFGGGIKQLTSFGPNGEIIMDYSIYDAIQAGFDRVVFVIRKDLEQDFKSIIGNRIAKHVDVDYAFQELKDLPEGFSLPDGRTKPWGTGQAILACKDVVDGSFAVINADDYYGKSAFVSMYEYLTQEKSTDKYAVGMAGFVLKNTLSEFGGVTRGICRVDQSSALLGIDETKNIVKTPEGAGVAAGDGSVTPLDENSLVSMNFWGFFPDFLGVLENGFKTFLGSLSGEALLKGEYLLPTIVDGLLKEGRVLITVKKSEDHWFGVTYKEDVPEVIRQIAQLIEQGAYPEKLWDQEKN